MPLAHSQFDSKIIHYYTLLYVIIHYYTLLYVFPLWQTNWYPFQQEQWKGERIWTQRFETYIILGNYSYYWIHYDLVVLIIPFIVYCVKMYVHKLNIRDKIWFICLWYCILTTTVPVFIYLIILFIVNICKPLRFPGTQR